MSHPWNNKDNYILHNKFNAHSLIKVHLLHVKKCTTTLLCFKRLPELQNHIDITVTLQLVRWRLNRLRLDCLFNHLFRSKKASKLRVTGLCEGNSPMTGNSWHKGPVTWKMFPFDDVTMILLWASEKNHNMNGGRILTGHFGQTKYP